MSFNQDYNGRQVIRAPDSGVPTLAGVVSWGVGCGKTSPGAGVYSDIRDGIGVSKNL